MAHTPALTMSAALPSPPLPGLGRWAQAQRWRYRTVCHDRPVQEGGILYLVVRLLAQASRWMRLWVSIALGGGSSSARFMPW